MRVPVILMLLSFAAALKHGSLQVGPHLRACSIRGEDEQLKLIRRREPIRYQVQTNLFVQIIQTSIWAIESISKGGAQAWEGRFAKV